MVIQQATVNRAAERALRRELAFESAPSIDRAALVIDACALYHRLDGLFLDEMRKSASPITVEYLADHHAIVGTNVHLAIQRVTQRLDQSGL